MALDDPQPEVIDFLTLKAWVKQSLDRHCAWYEEAKEAYDFVAGRQWKEDDEEAFKATGRPPIKFNLVGPTIDAICGMEVNNRQQVRFLPRTQGNVAINERLSDLADWARDECQAEDEESMSFRDTVICGRGFTETRLDFEEEPTGKIVVDRRDPLECFVDPNASKANFADARYLGDFKDIDTAEAMAMFPGIAWAALDAGWARTIDLQDGGEGYKRDYPEETRSALKDDKKPKTVRIVCIRWWDRERAYMVATPEGPQETPADVYEGLVEQLKAEGQEPPQAQAIWKRVYRQAYLGSNSILPTEEGETIQEADGFSLAAITGRWDRNKRFHYGVVRPLLDPQRIVNKSLVQTHQILNTNAKGGLMFEKSVFSNVRKAEMDWSDPSKNIEVNDGALTGGKIVPRVAPPLPPALTSLLELSMSSIRNVTGVNLEILGAADREQAASLEYQRRQSAMSILAPLFDALRRYRKTQGLILVACLRRLPPGVLVRVVQPEDQQQSQPGQASQQPQQAYAPFDPAFFGLTSEQDRFDVIVDEAPASPNQKQETWAALQPFLGKMPPQALQVALKYSPLPQAAAQELSEALGGGLPPEVQQMIQEGQQQIQQLTQENQNLKNDKTIEAAKVQSKAQADQASAQTEQFNAETDRIHKVAQLGAGGGGPTEIEIMLERFREEQDTTRQLMKQQHEIMMQHLKNAGQIAAARTRADATADQGIETNAEVGV